MKQELSFEQKTLFHETVKDKNFRESARLEGIKLNEHDIPQSDVERKQLMATIIARYTKKTTAVDGT